MDLVGTGGSSTFAMGINNVQNCVDFEWDVGGAQLLRLRCHSKSINRVGPSRTKHDYRWEPEELIGERCEDGEKEGSTSTMVVGWTSSMYHLVISTPLYNGCAMP